MPKPAAALRKNIVIFFWAELFAHVNFLTPLMSLFYLKRGLEYSDFFVILLIWVISVFLMEIPTGIFADKYGPKTSFICGFLLQFLSTFLLIYAFNRYVFFLSAALSATGFTFFSGSDQAYIYEILKELKRENEMSKTWAKIKSASLVPSVITILLGAYIARDLQEQQFLLLLVSTLFFNGLTLFLLIFLKTPAAFHLQKKQSVLFHFRSGLKNILSERSLQLLFINETLVMIPTYVIISNENLIQPYFQEAGFAVYLLGIIYAADALFSFFILNNIKWFEKRFKRKTLIFVTALLIFLTFAAGAALPASIPLALLIFFIIKLAFWLRYPLFQQIKNDYLPSGSRATALSILSMADSFFDILILGTFSFLADYGIATVFGVCALIVFGGMLFPVRIKKHQ